MCGRYRIKETQALKESLRDTFGIPDWEPDGPRYNIAPSQDCPVLIMDDEGDVVVPTSMRWGYVPFWDKSEKPKVAPINAQSETVATNGMFRQSVQRCRCLVPADGFYEWLRVDEKTKYPFDIHLKSRRPFFMAAVYESATPTRPATFAVLTTRPNELMAKIHTRMPAILVDETARRWIARGGLTPQQVTEFATPFPTEHMEAIPISQLVNSPRNELPEVLEPVAYTPPPKPAPKPVQGELF